MEQGFITQVQGITFPYSTQLRAISGSPRHPGAIRNRRTKLQTSSESWTYVTNFSSRPRSLPKKCRLGAAGFHFDPFSVEFIRCEYIAILLVAGSSRQDEVFLAFDLADDAN